MHDQWKAISTRIRSLADAAQLQAAYLTVNSSDTYASSRYLRSQAGEILSDAKAFASSFGKVLPPRGEAALSRATKEIEKLVTDASAGGATLQQQTWAAIVLLVAFEAEMSFVLTDSQEVLRVRSERAFAHLQRSIAVDDDLQDKWQQAFARGELACERLGAVHLLLHGIWAFKVSGAGAQTDLVFQDLPLGVPDPTRYADGLVLTEWKCARSPQDAAKRFEEARAQARRYRRGILAGTELTAYRFAVVISKDHIPVPDDVRDNGTVYRHINVAVQPSPPSKARS
jgi:hypothetical protein